MKMHRTIHVILSLMLGMGLLLSTVSSTRALPSPGSFWMVADINQDSTYREGSAYAFDGFWFKNKFIFSADDSIHNDELWSTTGTPESTHMIKDIYPGYIGTVLYGGIVFKDWFLFSADDGQHGYELWRTDATKEGTQMVYDLVPGVHWGDPIGLTPYKGEVYFLSRGTSYPKDIPSFWKTNGEASGTVKIKDLPVGSILNDAPIEFNGILYFFVRPTWPQLQLWRSDGTPEGTYEVITQDTTNSMLTELYPTTRHLFYYRIALDNSVELWQTDGDAKSTKLVKGVADSDQQFDTNWTDRAEGIGDTLYFVGQDETIGSALWKTRGVESGVELIRSFGLRIDSDQPNSLRSLGSNVYFCSADKADGQKVWRSDGTPAGTFPLLPEDHTYYGCFWMEEHGGRLFFNAWEDGQHDLWTSDGTSKGTWRLTYGNIKPYDFQPIVMDYVDGKVWFSGNDGIHGYELWVYQFNKDPKMDTSLWPKFFLPMAVR